MKIIILFSGDSLLGNITVWYRSKSIFNSVNLDCDGKFQDFKRSAIALRHVSDQICLEHGLSIIEKPGLSKGYNRGEYPGEQKPLTMRDKLPELIDDSLRGCKSFDEFIAAMKASGMEIKRGKHLAFKIPGGKKFIRCDPLGDDYTEDALRERISGKRVVAPKQKAAAAIPVPQSPICSLTSKENPARARSRIRAVCQAAQSQRNGQDPRLFAGAWACGL